MNPLLIWSSLLLLPLIPVVLLYYFFEGQSYFGLENTAKGIVAAGPIAAYAVIIQIGWRMYGRIFEQSSRQEANQFGEQIQQLENQLKNSRQEANQFGEQIQQLENQLQIQKLTSSKTNKLAGRWSFTSTSSHKRTLTGECSISQSSQGILSLSGFFAENGQQVGTLTSELAQIIQDNTLAVIYRMEEMKRGRLEQHRGVCTFQFNESLTSNLPINKMTGFWIVVGREDMFGNVNYIKMSSS